MSRVWVHQRIPWSGAAWVYAPPRLTLIFLECKRRSQSHHSQHPSCLPICRIGYRHVGWTRVGNGTAVRVAGQDKAQPMWSWCFYQTNWKICITSYMWYVYIQIEVSTVHSLAMDAVPAGTKPHLFFRESSVVCSSSPLPFLEEPPGYAPSFHFRREMWVMRFCGGRSKKIKKFHCPLDEFFLAQEK